MQKEMIKESGKSSKHENPDADSKVSTISNMNEYLNKPFPFIEKKNHRILASVLFSGFIYVFLLIFQPFGISNIQYYKPVFVAGFFGITLVVMLFSFLVVPNIFKSQFDFDNWTIKKNAIFIIIQFLFITVFNWIYNSTVGKGITAQHSLFYFIFITVSVGIIPTLFLIYFIERNLLRRNQHIATNFSKNIQERTKNTENSKIKLSSQNNKETITIELNQLMCIKAEGNYLKVFFRAENETKSKLIRNSIKNIEEQLAIFENIIRCHRSYIVNLDMVSKVSGNARNFSLHLEKLGPKIPVSRSFPKDIFQKLDS